MQNEIDTPDNNMMWNFRPSAFTDHVREEGKDYARMTSDYLYELYMNDNKAAEGDGVVVPPKPEHDDDDTTQSLRTLQWNVHHFRPTADYPNGCQLAMAIADRVIETEADIVVLNEFGIHPSTMSDMRLPWEEQQDDNIFDEHNCHNDDGQPLRAPDYAKSRLELYGYSLYKSTCFFPTVVAIKNEFPLAGGVKKFPLDGDRAVVAVPVNVLGDTDDTKTTPPVCVYGTHLEAGEDMEGNARRIEMERLLQLRDMLQKDDNSMTMIVGDFNQQRQQDYAPQEWDQIFASKWRRRSPLDDGVASQLKEAGFQCVFDDAVLKSSGIDRNWPQDTPPPSTHWSGTLIDYTYFQGEGLELAGVYVSPCSMSDHRMVVCDWNVQPVEKEVIKTATLKAEEEDDGSSDDSSPREEEEGGEGSCAANNELRRIRELSTKSDDD